MSEYERLRRLVAGDDGDTEAALERRLTELDDIDDAAAVGLDGDLRTLKALGNRTRYRIVRVLVAADREALTVGELDAVLAVSQSAISHALATLADAGLVERRSEGTWRYYTDTERARRLVAALEATRD